jgi:hypothetical protein
MGQLDSTGFNLNRDLTSAVRRRRGVYAHTAGLALDLSVAVQVDPFESKI